jgi:hypothetical protein
MLTDNEKWVIENFTERLQDAVDARNNHGSLSREFRDALENMAYDDVIYLLKNNGF